MICRLWEVELKLTIGAAYSDVIKWEMFGETWSLTRGSRSSLLWLIQGDGKILDGWVDYIGDHGAKIVCENQADVSEIFLEHFFLPQQLSRVGTNGERYLKKRNSHRK